MPNSLNLMFFHNHSISNQIRVSRHRTLARRQIPHFGRARTEESSKLLHFVTVFSLLLGLAGCEKPSAEIEIPAGVKGYVFEVNPILFLPNSSDAPVGSKPLTNAIVSLVRFDQTVASTRTDEDGSFTIFENVSGTYRLEVRKTASAETPDTFIPVTLVADTMLTIGQTPVVNRERAVETVLELASPAALVACVQNPLPAGTKVEPTFGPPADAPPTADFGHVVAANGAWFCIHDENQFHDFGHELEYLFVDAATAEVKRIPGQIWWPRINGMVIWTYGDDLFFSDDPSMSPDAIATRPISILLKWNLTRFWPRLPDSTPRALTLSHWCGLELLSSVSS